ncbi:thiamine pyrophosphate-requiring protein [Roseiarcaceae bacterium H3SJ34-1]|uniref:thiamine pyrophosphate-requiring protein n=1 Tax=Terripilifer ovatus TaxID=3032367 RepID=UPI003AB99FCE|nr:thiamine pyrophosphate-requiring protein [Roseiarcaceae bacterium H3SJ34-1]
MNGADVVAKILKLEGTDFLACYPRNPLIEACADIDIRPILCRQERVGVGMADGYSRVRRGRQNGVFAAQHGPGIENAFPGVAQAFSENVPMLVIPAASSLDRQYIRPTFRAADVFAPVTKWSAVAHDVRELPDLMRRAFHAMRTGKPGPVLVEIPNEVFDAQFSGDLDYVTVPVLRSAPDPAAVKAAARLLLAAKNPLIWAGQGIHYAEAGELLTALAELIPAPVAATNPGKSAIAESHPLALGASTASRPKMYAEGMNEADLVFAIGSSLTRTPFGPALPRGKTIIHSSNDFADINKDIRADLGLVGDAALVIEALIEEIGRQRAKPDTARLSALKDKIAASKKAWRADWEKQLNSDEVPINQYRVINDLMRVADRDNVIITHEAGSPREQLLPMWETTKPASYLGWGKSTQLGYGLGLAMGAKLAAPEKLCINVMGDASFGMTGMDIETAARNDIGILTVVFNNAVMACERHMLEKSTRKYDALDIGGNYEKLAQSLNVASRRVENPADIVPTIKEAIETTQKGKPFLLEIAAKEGYDFSRYA